VKEKVEEGEGGVRPTWKIRRKIVITSLLFCGIVIVYVVWSADDTRVNETALIGSFGLMGSVIASYVFGAVWDDKTPDRQVGGRGRPNRGPGE